MGTSPCLAEHAQNGCANITLHEADFLQLLFGRYTLQNMEETHESIQNSQEGQEGAGVNVYKLFNMCL